MHDDRVTRFEKALAQRILVIDGAMGSMLMRHKLDEDAYRGTRFASHASSLMNCADVLVFTQPQIVEDIHALYLEAGADIIETNSFNANAYNLGEYGLAHLAHEMNVEAARVARRAVDRAMDRDPSRMRWVAGSIGPTSRSLSISPDANNPAARSTTFDEMVDAYAVQVRGLLDGGVDILLPETAFDTLNLKACLVAIDRVFRERATRVPVMVSGTIPDFSGRTLSGQKLEALWVSVEHARPTTVGLNCALGPDRLRPYVEELSGLADTWVHVYPNAGLPDPLSPTGFPETPESLAPQVEDFARNGWVNLVGGCCGTTPEHIRLIAQAVAKYPPRKVPTAPAAWTRLSGLEPYTIRPETNFTMIGERTNVTGSKRFARLIKDGLYEEAVAVARDQVNGGANVIDVNMDEGMLDGVAAMTRFLNQIGAEPDVARVPVMVDSSKWEVLEAGLKCLQGKGIVNSISLKEGEAKFLEQAAVIQRYGAAVVVMCFDETGQAVETEHKVAVAERAFALLTTRAGFHASDIIVDPNILTVGTGIEEHANYALNFVEATRRIKANCPGVRISGGVSNISFAFRGNDVVREAMHAAFLYRAIEAGLDMAIVNAGQLAVYDEIPRALRDRVEDVLWNRRPDATERLIAYSKEHGGATRGAVEDLAWRAGDLQSRVTHALVHGVDAFIEDDMREALGQFPAALAIIEGPLMRGMNVVGDLFGDGKMFLPQVVKSARVMKRAVRFLEDYMPRGAEAAAKGTALLATVKGDVHDIGKNIVGVVLACNGYRIVDLGVMVPADRILERAREERADVIGLSGLITPSLDEMVHVAREMKRTGFEVPLLIGGATTSAKHTAVKIAPSYPPGVVHVKDASRCAGVMGRLLSPEMRAGFLADNLVEQERLRQRHSQRKEVALLPIATARSRGAQLAFDAPAVPAFLGVRSWAKVPLAEVVPYIDWAPFFHAWEFTGTWPAMRDDPRFGTKVQELHADALALLETIVREGRLEASAVYGFFAANREGDDLVLYTDEARTAELARLPMLRQQEAKTGDAPMRSLADYVAPVGVADHLGLFVVTAGLGCRELAAGFERDHDDYRAIIAKALADRLAEAFTEMLHERMRAEWGFGERLPVSALLGENYRGIRPAPGYPACPDHLLKETMWKVFAREHEPPATLTESLAMDPAASVCGMVFGHPEARYFSVGPIGRDQVHDYAARMRRPVVEVQRWLSPSLAYDAED